MSSRSLIRICLFAGTAVMTACAPAIPAAGSLVTGEITKKTAKDIINEAETAAQNLLSQAERTGNALLGRLGNELSVAAANAALVVGDEADRVINKLSREVSPIVASLNELIDTANGFTKGAFELKDAAVLDLRSALGDVRFFVSRTDFMVQRIDGLMQIERTTAAEYKFSISGLGVGTDTSKMRNHVSQFLIDGKPVEFVESRSRANKTDLNLPNTALRGFFNRTKLVFLPVQITVDVETKKTLGGWKARSYTVPLRLALMPKTAGRVTVSWANDKLDWVNVLPEPSKYTHTTPDHNCHSGDCRFFPESGQQRVPGNQRFVNPKVFGCGGEGCPWTRNSRATILGGGTILEFWTEAQGSPATHTYGALIQELRVVGEVPGSKAYDLVYGSDLVIELPAKTKYWRIRGTTASFQSIDVVVDQSGDVLKYRRQVVTGDKLRVIYAVVAPPGFQ